MRLRAWTDPSVKRSEEAVEGEGKGDVDGDNDLTGALSRAGCIWCVVSFSLFFVIDAVLPRLLC